MTIPRPKVPVLIVKGTQKCLAVLHGDDVMIDETQVWDILDVDTGCLSEAESFTDEVMQDLDGNDIGTASVTSTGKIVWAV